MNKMNYLFDACVSHRNTLKVNKQLDIFFDKEEDKFYKESNQDYIKYHPGCSLYVRCMSHKEYKAIIKGKTIINETNFTDSSVSTSKGFCFFKYTNDEDALINYEARLSLFASDEVMLVVALPDTIMKKSMGLYAEGWVEEYCTTWLHISQDMIHHALFNIKELIEADENIQKRIYG